MFASLIALLLAAETAPPSEVASLFRVDDYPSEALEKNESGEVGVEVSVGGNGRVAGCRIISSSKSKSLDKATCDVIARRGDFSARAKEHGGKPFAFETHVTWAMGPTGIPLTVVETRIVFTPGQPVACHTETPEWMRMDGACDLARVSAEDAIARLSKEGRLDGLEYVVEMTSIPGDHLTDNRVGEGVGQQLLGRQTVLLTLGADGKIANCAGGEDSLSGDIAGWCSSFVKNEIYEPMPAGMESHSARQLTKINAIYLRPRQAPRDTH